MQVICSIVVKASVEPITLFRWANNKEWFSGKPHILWTTLLRFCMQSFSFSSICYPTKVRELSLLLFSNTIGWGGYMPFSRVLAWSINSLIQHLNLTYRVNFFFFYNNHYITHTTTSSKGEKNKNKNKKTQKKPHKKNNTWLNFSIFSSFTLCYSYDKRESLVL